jgi:hypothetical protein
MCFRVLRPSPSSRWEHRLVDAFGTHVVPTINAQLRILACVFFAMSRLAPVDWASHRVMPGFDVEAATITHIPVVILFDDGWGVVALHRCRGHGWRVWTIRRLDNSTRYKPCTCSLSRIVTKRIGTSTRTTRTTASTTPHSTPTVSLIETAHLIRCRNGK